jgi:hypothetical protein
MVIINFNNNTLQITKRKTMDINKWKSLAVAINSWKDLWAMKNLPDFKYLRPGTIISTLIDAKVTELANKEGISEDEWRKKYHSFRAGDETKTPSKKRKRKL